VGHTIHAYKCGAKILRKGDQYCNLHQCQHLGCVLRSINRYNYCAAHVNQHVKTNCGCTIKDNGEFRRTCCKKHTCRNLGCLAKPVSNSLYCELHTCKICQGLATMKHTTTDKSYCQKCFLKICQPETKVKLTIKKKLVKTKPVKKKPAKKKVPKKEIPAQEPLISFEDVNLLA